MCHPLKGVTDDYQKVGRIVVIIWIISAAASAPLISMAIFKDSVYKDGTPFKACRTYLFLHWHKAYIVILSVVFFVLPSSILLGLYCKVCYVLHIARKESIRLGQTNKYKDKKRLKRQVINILTSIVLLFFVCHLPYRVLGIWTTFGSGRTFAKLGFETYYSILYSCRIMFYLNHAVNPIIYNFVSTKFRNAMRYMFTGQGRFGSLASSHHQRLVKGTSRHTEQGQNHVLIINKGFKNQERKTTTETVSPDGSSARKKRNEFFPMYASIIEENCNASKEDISNTSDRCELQIKLVDKDVNMCINYKNGKRKNTASTCCHMV